MVDLDPSDDLAEPTKDEARAAEALRRALEGQGARSTRSAKDVDPDGPEVELARALSVAVSESGDVGVLAHRRLLARAVPSRSVRWLAVAVAATLVAAAVPFVVTMRATELASVASTAPLGSPLRAAEHAAGFGESTEGLFAPGEVLSAEGRVDRIVAHRERALREARFRRRGVR